MEEVSKVIVRPLKTSFYKKPYTISFVQNGTGRTLDLLMVPDGVTIILFNITRNVLIFVKQFRPAVYFGSIPPHDRQLDEEIDTKKYPPNLGITLELCGGIVDKNKTNSEIAKEEILEECGYDVPLHNIKKIGSYRSAVTSVSVQHVFYCEVTDDMKVSSGGGIDDEIIELIEMTVDEVKKYITQSYVKSPPSLMFAMYWFLVNKC